MSVLAEVQTLRITKIKEHIGAEATGIDLRRSVDADARQRLGLPAR